MEIFTKCRIRTDRLLIRNYEMSDLAALHELIDRPEMLRYLPESSFTYESAKETLAGLIRCYEENRPERIRKFSLALTLLDGGDLVGWCGLGPLPYDPERLEIYYGIAHPQWGRGYATEAAAAVLGYAFDRIGLERVVAIAMHDNVASRRVLEKIGMKEGKRVGGLPDEHRVFEGCHFFSMSREEWRSGKGPEGGGPE